MFRNLKFTFKDTLNLLLFAVTILTWLRHHEKA